MAYQVKRIDPYWIAHPVLPILVLAGAVIARVGYMRYSVPLQCLGGLLISVGVLASAKIVVSAVLGTLGVFGGLVTFIILPRPELANSTMGMKLLAVLFFAYIYVVLMDALVLAFAFLYNLFGAAMGGVSLDLEEGGGTQP